MTDSPYLSLCFSLEIDSPFVTPREREQASYSLAILVDRVLSRPTEDTICVYVISMMAAENGPDVTAVEMESKSGP